MKIEEYDSKFLNNGVLINETISYFHFNINYFICCVIPVESTPSVNTGSVFVPVLVQDNQNNVYVCQIKAFTETFRSENTNRGRARLDVKKQCTAKYHDMFCSDEEIKCTEY